RSYSSIFLPSVLRWIFRSLAARERLPRCCWRTREMNFFSNSRFASSNKIPFSIISETSDSSCCFTGFPAPSREKLTAVRPAFSLRKDRRCARRLGGAVTAITCERRSGRRRSVARRSAQAAERFFVFFPRARHHFRGERGTGGTFVPGQRLQVIAHVLLVEARRVPSRRPSVPRPEARGVRGQGFVDPHKAVVPDSELELRVGEDETARLRVGARPRVEGEASLARLLG